MKALMYHSNHNRRFAAALVAAAVIHVAAIGLARTREETPPIVSAPPSDPEIQILLPGLTPEPQPEQSDPSPTPPPMDQTFIDETSTPPPIKRQTSKLVAPLVKRTRGTGSTPSMTISSARVFAINAPRPEYPYEARRQRITGDGVVAMTVDPVSGEVTDVSIVKGTGSPFLDNAAVTGFKRWRFKPGTVGSVRCPITFTLVGASY